MEKKAYQEFGWNTANAPFYHKYLCKPIEKMLPTDGDLPFWISVAETGVLRITSTKKGIVYTASMRPYKVLK